MTQTDKHSVVLWYLHAHTATHCITRERNPDYQNHHALQDHTKPVPKKTVTFKTSEINLTRQGIHEVIIPAPAIPHLLTLRTLRLQSNHLATLPLHLFHLTGLHELNLAYNRLTTLPPELGLLTSLRELFLHNNSLTELPPQIGLLKYLAVLDITANRLRYLPANIAQLDSLRKFWAEGNWFDIDDRPHVVTSSSSSSSSSSFSSIATPATFSVTPTSSSDFLPLPRRQPLRLTSICAQIVGTVLSTSPHHYCPGAGPTCRKHVPDLLPHTTLALIQPPGNYPSLAIPCARCGVTMFHAGVPLVESGVRKLEARITVVRRVCGQVCWRGWRCSVEGIEWEAVARAEGEGIRRAERNSVVGGWGLGGWAEGRRRRDTGKAKKGRQRSRTI